MELRDSSDVLDDARELRGRALDDGYVFLRALLDRELAHDLRDVIFAVHETNGWPVRGALSEEQFVELQRSVQPTDAFRKLAECAALHDAMDTVLGEPCRGGQGDICRLVLPGVSPTAPHQDGFYTRGDGLWTAWLPLDDCPVERGPLAVAPASHRHGLLEHDATGIVERQPRTYAFSHLFAGDALLFSDHTAHRALANASDAARVSVEYRFRALNESSGHRREIDRVRQREKWRR